MANFKVNILEQRFTDVGISELVARYADGNICYWTSAGKWLFWDEKRWVSDMPGGMFPIIKRVIKELYGMAIFIEDADKKKQTLKAIMSLESYYSQQSVIKSMQVLPELIVSNEKLDRDPMLLSSLNGTIELTTGNLKPHCRLDNITRIINIEYNALADCPKFKQFLSDIFGNNKELIAFIQRFFGYCLTGRTDEQSLCFFYGTGSNGKTTLLKIFLMLLSDFAASAQSDLLMLKNNDNGASNDLACLRGTRLVAVNEINEGAKLDEAKLKTMTGGDVLKVRFLFQEYFEYVPQFKLVLVGNHKPVISGRDFGIWRRIHLIPFTHTIPQEERDPMILEKLKAELPGILAWAVRGCLEWQRIGLKPPKEITDAVIEYQADEDVFGSWLNGFCERGSDNLERACDLLESFISATGLNRISPKKFANWLKEEGFKQERKLMGICWTGLKLKTN